MSGKTHTEQSVPPLPTRSDRRYRADWAALAAYLVLALLLTLPLASQFATHVPGDGRDDPALAWNLWWVPYALLHLGVNPITTDYMFYPIGLNLAFYTLTPLNALLSIPFQYAINLASAANLDLLLSFTLSGYGTFLLARYLLTATARVERKASEPPESGVQPANSAPSTFILLAAFIAGAVYAFSSNKLLYASLGQFNIASSQWIPFYVLFLLLATRTGGEARNAEDRSPRPSHRRVLFHGLLLGLFLLLQGWSELIFASFLILLTAVYLIYWLTAQRPRPEQMGEVAVSFVTAALVFVAGMAPILSAMVREMWVEGDYIQSGLGFADVFSNDLLGFLVPSHLHPLWGGLESQFHFAYTNFAFLGYGALALAALALIKMPRARLWGALGALGVLVTLGPTLRVNGQAIPLPFLPFNALLEIPLVKGNRYPSRWSVMVTLCLGVLVGYGALRVLQWVQARSTSPASGARRSWLAAAGLLALVLFEHLAVPLPTSDLRIPTVYETIAQDTGDFSVLEIPLAWRNGFRQSGTPDAEMMFEQWYQTQHRHPILGGNTSRNAELKFQYFAEAPVIRSLIAVENGHALDSDRLRADKELAAEVLRFFGVRYVIWHSPRDPRNRAALDAARRYVEQNWPVTRFYDVNDETGETIGYRVAPLPAAASVTLSASGALARLQFAEGWGALGNERFAWAQRNEVRLLARLDPGGRAVRLTLAATLPAGLSRQTVSVMANGRPAGRLTLEACTECRAELVLDAAALRSGMNEIVLQFERTVPVSGIRLPDTVAANACCSVPANVVVRSAGEEQGNFGHIYVDGRDLSPNARGYNLVVLNPQTGAVEATAAFDTFASEAESGRLADFLRKVPDGRLVLAAVRDEAARHLTNEAVDALRSIGAAVDLRNRFRWSHAVIGVKGSPPGSALEAASEIQTSQLIRGAGVTEPQAAAAVEWIRIQAE